MSTGLLVFSYSNFLGISWHSSKHILDHYREKNLIIWIMKRLLLCSRICSCRDSTDCLDCLDSSKVSHFMSLMMFLIAYVAPNVPMGIFLDGLRYTPRDIHM